MLYLIGMFLLGMLICFLFGFVGIYAGYNFYLKDKGSKKTKWETKFAQASESEETNDEQNL